MMIFFEYIFVGLVGGMGLIILSKIVIAKALRKDENYYEEKIDRGGDQNE